jgi:predicted Zn-ribbon and HTH transcriptional regulator
MLAVANDVPTRPKFELAHIFGEYGQSYRHNLSLPLSHLRVMRAVEHCRTSFLGGHLQQCDFCGFEHPAYNSCRNRHCPKCQSLAKARWIEKQNSELLPTGYFHLTFTLPHQLNCLILTNQTVLFNLLFKAVSETLSDFARTHLGGTLGFTAVLHTWNQILLDHFHLHCLIPQGALSFDQKHWIPARKNFLFRVEPLSIVFQGKFLDFLQKAFNQQKLIFPGKTSPLANPPTFKLLVNTLHHEPWIVHAKKPFGSPKHLLNYLGRYVHRVALSNDRILSVHKGEVTFIYRDRKHGDQLRTMKLKVKEFIRRFLLHVLPSGFMRIRHFGFLANRSKTLLSKCRTLLGLHPTIPKLAQRSTHQIMLELTGIDTSRCPRCKTGTLAFLAILPACKSYPAGWDSS